MKKFLLLIVIIKIILSVVFLYTLDVIATRAFNHYGSKILGMQVHVDDVVVSLLHSSITVNNLLVQGPKGFKNPYVLDLKTFNVKVDLLSVFDDVVHIKDIYIDSPVVIYEVNPQGDIINLIKNNVAKYGQEATEYKESSVSSGKTTKKVIIDHLYIKAATVAADVSQIGSHTLSLNDIEISGIGSPNGITFDKATNIVLKQLSTEIIRSGINSLVDHHAHKLLNKLNQKVEEVKQKGADKLEDSINKLTDKLLKQ